MHKILLFLDLKRRTLIKTTLGLTSFYYWGFMFNLFSKGDQLNIKLASLTFPKN